MSNLINYPFFDLDNLKSRFLEDKSSIGSKFERIIVIGVGGSSQGSKAINGFLNEIFDLDIPVITEDDIFPVPIKPNFITNTL